MATRTKRPRLIPCKYKRWCREVDMPPGLQHEHGPNADHDPDYENCPKCILESELDELYDARHRDLYDDDEMDFAEPGGESALRAENIIRLVVNNGRSYSYRCPNHGCHATVQFRDKFCRGCGKQLQIRNQPCPTCGAEDVLTSADVERHYQCNACARRAEMGW